MHDLINRVGIKRVRSKGSGQKGQCRLNVYSSALAFQATAPALLKYRLSMDICVALPTTSRQLLLHCSNFPYPCRSHGVVPKGRHPCVIVAGARRNDDFFIFFGKRSRRGLYKPVLISRYHPSATVIKAVCRHARPAGHPVSVLR